MSSPETEWEFDFSMSELQTPPSWRSGSPSRTASHFCCAVNVLSRNRQDPRYLFKSEVNLRESVGRRSRLQLTRDECFDHLLRLVGERARVGDPLVLSAFEDLELDVAARRLV